MLCRGTRQSLTHEEQRVLVSVSNRVAQCRNEHRSGLQVRLSEDEPDGAPYATALAAFRSRTCYANADGDHLVGMCECVYLCTRLRVTYQTALSWRGSCCDESRCTLVA